MKKDRGNYQPEEQPFSGVGVVPLPWAGPQEGQPARKMGQALHLIPLTSYTWHLESQDAATGCHTEQGTDTCGLTRWRQTLKHTHTKTHTDAGGSYEIPYLCRCRRRSLCGRGRRCSRFRRCRRRCGCFRCRGTATEESTKHATTCWKHTRTQAMSTDRTSLCNRDSRLPFPRCQHRISKLVSIDATLDSLDLDLFNLDFAIFQVNFIQSRVYCDQF